MTKQDKITALNELLADKTLSFGCKIKIKAVDGFVNTVIAKDCEYKNNNFDWKTLQSNGVDVIGHPVTLARVLLKMAERCVENKKCGETCVCGYDENIKKIIGMWRWGVDTLEQQSSEMIDFLYDLFLSPNNK